MSYTRGDNYIWRSDDRVHLWIADGEDGWAESGWNEARSHPMPGGVAVPQAVMDEYVVMRFAELLQDQQVGQAVERALARNGGNGGCSALGKVAEQLKRLVAT